MSDTSRAVHMNEVLPMMTAAKGGGVASEWLNIMPPKS